MPRIRRQTMKVYVQHVSMDALKDTGWELGDNGFQAENAASLIQNDWLFDCLTRRQRSVATLLIEGYTRRETAEKLEVSLQAVHQIVLRMRQRLEIKGRNLKIKKGEYQLLKNLVYVYFLANPNKDAEEIFKNWYKHSVLTDYDRPEISLLKSWVTEFKYEIKTYGR